MHLLCTECGAVLTDEEREYYSFRCEGCETESHERIEAWRHGAEDLELDALYDARPIAH